MRKVENLTTSCAIVMKSGNLKFLEPSGPLQACNGAAFTTYLAGNTVRKKIVEWKEVLLQRGYAFSVSQWAVYV